jgi:hypothetical protein
MIDCNEVKPFNKGNCPLSQCKDTAGTNPRFPVLISLTLSIEAARMPDNRVFPLGAGEKCLTGGGDFL